MLNSNLPVLATALPGILLLSCVYCCRTEYILEAASAPCTK